MAKYDVAALPALSDQAYKDGFTRPYSGPEHISKPEPAKPANDNVPSHEWPASDQCLENNLLRGSDEAETTALNGLALIELSRIRRLLESASSKPNTWPEHSGAEVPADENGNVGYEPGQPFTTVDITTAIREVKELADLIESNLQ